MGLLAIFCRGVDAKFTSLTFTRPEGPRYLTRNTPVSIPVAVTTQYTVGRYDTGLLV